MLFELFDIIIEFSIFELWLGFIENRRCLKGGGICQGILNRDLRD